MSTISLQIDLEDVMDEIDDEDLIREAEARDLVCIPTITNDEIQYIISRLDGGGIGTTEYFIREKLIKVWKDKI